MNPGPPLDPLQKPTLPQDIEDHALAILVDCLHDLATLIENRCRGQPRRHPTAQCRASAPPDAEPESIPDPPF